MSSRTSQTSSMLPQASIPAAPTRGIDGALDKRARTIAAHRSLRVDDLSEETRQELGPALYAIFCEAYGALDLETVCDEIIFKSGGHLGLYYNFDGNLIGFTAAKVSLVEVAGRSHGIMGGGAYFHRGVRGGIAAITYCLKMAVAFKVRHPFTPLYYVCEALTPVSYRRMVRSMAGVWPRRDETSRPPHARVLEAVLDQRGFARSADRPHVIRYSDPASHHRADEVRTSASLENDPDVHFYLSQNPSFADCDILCCIVPLDFSDIARSFFTNLASAFRR